MWFKMNRKLIYSIAAVLFLNFLYTHYLVNGKFNQLLNSNREISGKMEFLNTRMEAMRADIEYAARRNHVNMFSIPDKISFCGENLNLKDQVIREKVEREFYALLGKPGQIQLYLKRINRYFPMIENYLMANGMPPDLKYLAVHESALLPEIRSSANAVGLWQFMPVTGKKYGLRVDRIVDERRDPEKSTRAAIRYLRYLKDRFDKWPLAMAAYNGGPSRLSRALNDMNSEELVSLVLPDETERYYFKIVATKIILSNPLKYGFELNEAEAYRPLKSEKLRVTVNSSKLTLDSISEACGIDIHEFQNLNPSVRKGYLTRGSYSLNFPPGSKNTMEEYLREVNTQMAINLVEDRQTELLIPR